MSQLDAAGSNYEQYVTQMKLRTKAFALRIISLCRSLSKDFTLKLISGQLLRCGTAVGVNYRAACRARTPREFTSKIRVVMEEADETHYWLEILTDSKILPAPQLAPLTVEARELTAIFTSAHAKAARRSAKKPPSA